MQQPSVQLEEILDECVAAIQEQGQTIEDCLTRYAVHRAELAPLLQVVVRLQQAHTLQPTIEFRRASAVRVRNLVAARPRKNERTVASFVPSFAWPNLVRTWRGAVLAAALVVLLVVVMGSGAVSASNDTLPGDALYPVKRTVETMQLALSRDQASSVRLHLNLAARRLEEAQALLRRNRASEMEQALAGYTGEMEAASTLIIRESKMTTEKHADLVKLLSTAQTRHEAQLMVLSEQSPEAVRATIQRAIQFSRTARDRVHEPGSVAPRQTPEPAHAPPPSSTPLPSPTLLPTPEPPDIPTLSPAPQRTDRPAPSAWPTPVNETTPMRPRETPTAWPTQAPPPRATPFPWPTAVLSPQPTRWILPTPPAHSTPQASPLPSTPPIRVTRSRP